jgi:hypothetical protein
LKVAKPLSAPGTPSDSDPGIKIEHGVAIIETPEDREKREKREADERRAEYDKAQFLINKQQLKVNRRLAFFTGLLLITSLMSGAVAIWEASIAANAAAAAKKSADAALSTYDAVYGEQGIAERTIHQMVDQTVAQSEAALAAKDSIRNTQEQMRLDERAWVGVMSFRLTQNTVTKQTSVLIRLNNSGKTPALDGELGMKQGFNVGPIDWSTVPTSRDFAFDTKLGAYASGAVKTFEPPFAYGNLTSQQILNGVLNEGWIYYFYGEIRYHDTFTKAWHYTDFCIYTDKTVATSSEEQITNCPIATEMS